MTGDEPAVLLVDDRPENLLALRAVLEPLDCRLVSVTSGEDALKALLQDEFAIVLLDVQMPGMDGFETAELIKGRRRTRAVPIIFVTAISKERQHVFRGYEAGAVDYLFKPYDPELLRSKVRVFLELDAKTRAAAHSEALLRAAFAYAPFGMARLDSEGRFAEVNRALASLLDHEPAELHDRLLESLVHRDDQLSPQRRRALLTGASEGERHEARLLNAVGEAIPCLLTYSPARVGDGVPPTLLLSVEDLRARRAAELERDGRIREQIARAEAERSSDALRALQSISDAAIGGKDFETLIGDLLDRTAAALGVDTVAIVLDQGDGTSVAHQIAGGAEGGVRRWYSVVGNEQLGREHGEPLAARTAATLQMPLADGGETLGSLHVGTLFARRFTTGERDLLRLAADRAALAIQRVRAHQRDHAITEELQRSLLPAVLPEVEGATLAARYFPGGAGERVGGDWYDVVVQAGGRLLLVIGDVAGHGISAASAMGQLRSALRAYALDGHGPGAILERLNGFQIGMQVRGMSTVALVQVDLAAQRATYAAAGHLPPLIADGHGEAEWLEGALGPPLGAMEDLAYPERDADLGPGATLVLYTDGLVERRGESLDAGLARLHAVLADPPGQPDALCERLLEQTLSGELEDADDDVTFLVLRTQGERSPSARQLTGGTWPYRTVRSARVELPRTTVAAGAARRIVSETLGGAVAPAELVDVHAIVSEVVNNAVVHGNGSARDPQVVVHLAAAPEMLRVEVSNDGGTFTAPAPSQVDVPGGFGLVIVERLSSRWGIDFEDGVCVWFEIDRN